MKIEPGTKKEWRRREEDNRINGRKRPLPTIVEMRESKFRKEDRCNNIMRDGLDFGTSKRPLGRHRMGGDEDCMTGTGEGSLRKDGSSETSFLEPKQGTYDREKNESEESTYLPLSQVI